MALYTPFLEDMVGGMVESAAADNRNKLYGSAYMGEPGAMEELMHTDPERGIALQKSKQGEEQTKLQAAAKREADIRKSYEENRELIDGVIADTAKFEDFDEAKAYFDRKQEEHRPLIGDALSDVELTEDMWRESKTVQAEKPKAESGFQGLIASWKAAEEGSEEQKLLEQKLGKEVAQSKGIKINADGSVEIGGQVGIEPEKPIKRVTQEKIISSGESLARLDRIKKNYNPYFLTYKGKLEKGIISIMSKAGSDLSKEDKQMLGKYRKFTQGVNREFSAYRKLITGAAASVQELESLKKDMISDDLSPVEFEAAFNEYSAELARTIRIRNKVLREGIKEGTKQYGDELDRLYLTGADDDVNARGEELEAEGLSDQKILEALEQEGYL